MQKIVSAITLIAFFNIFPPNHSGAQTTVKIDPTLPPSGTCDGKPGYKLVFNDEFDSFNSSTWDKSSPGDDSYDYDYPDFCELSKQTPPNVYNVSAAGGIVSLLVREGEMFNTCDFSGAEMKSFNNFPGGIQHWKMYANSYLEARIKVAFCRGTASSFWLYGGEADLDGDGFGRFFEIDMFETGTLDPTHLGANIHYGKSYAQQQTGQKDIVIRDTEGDPVDLADQFLTFGVEITDAEIKMYINGMPYATYAFFPYFQGLPWQNAAQFRRPVPFNIRIGESATLASNDTPADCGELPKSMEVDYIRLYRKSNVETIKFTNGTNNRTFCSDFPWGDGQNVSLEYYPGIEYQWGSTPFFKFAINPTGLNECNCKRWWVSVVPGPPAGDYSVPITITLPCVVVETKTLKIKVLSGAPAPPTHIFLANSGAFTFPYVQQSGNSIAYEWSIGSTTNQHWQRVVNNQNGPYNIWQTDELISLPHARQVTVCVRTVSVCGVSSSYCQTVTIPGIHDNLYQGYSTPLLPPNHVFVEQIPNSANFRLGVQRAALSESYDWSFDQDYWHTVSNSTGVDYNYFGEFEAGTEPFPIYVRARQQDTLSYVYTERVTFPAPLPRPVNSPSIDIPLVDSTNLLERTNTVEEELLFENFTLYNTFGQLIKTGRIQVFSMSEIRESLPAGFYFLVKNSADNKKRVVTKFLITK